MELSCVRAAGEIYATSVQPKERLVRILRNVPGDVVSEDNRGGRYYETLDKILDGWTARCGPPDGRAGMADQVESYQRGNA